jgi:hypothetical protein
LPWLLAHWLLLLLLWLHRLHRLLRLLLRVPA